MSDINTKPSKPVASGAKSQKPSSMMMEAIDAAQRSEARRQLLPDEPSPGEFLALTFEHPMKIQPHILLATLALPEDFKFMINVMANEDGEAARDKFMEQSLVMIATHQFIFMDLRAPASKALINEVVDQLSLLRQIKGVKLLSITRVKYTDNIPALPVPGPRPPPLRDFKDAKEFSDWTHVTFALMWRGSWHIKASRSQLAQLGQGLEIAANDEKRNYLKEHPELFKNKEALMDKLDWKLNRFNYSSTEVMLKFEEQYESLSIFDRQVCQTIFRNRQVHMLSPQIRKASSLYVRPRLAEDFCRALVEAPQSGNEPLSSGHGPQLNADDALRGELASSHVSSIRSLHGIG